MVVKAVGVVAVTVVAVAVVATVGVITGMVVVGSDGLITMSGNTLSLGQALGRVALATAYMCLQMGAVAAIALAISSLTEHPLVVLASVLGGLTAFTVLGSISALEWLRPVLLTTDLAAFTDVLRDPIAVDGMTSGSWRALCYIVIGIAATFARMATKDS